MNASEASRQASGKSKSSPVALTNQLNERLVNLFNQAPVALIELHGPQWIIALANPLACQLWGRPQADLLGKSLLEVLPELKIQGWKEMLESVRSSGVPYQNHELSTQLTRNGKLETVYFTIVFHPLQDQHATISGISLVATEITEQVLVRQALEARVRQTEQILDGIPQMAWTTDEKGIHTFFNRRWYDYIGVSTNSTLVAQTWEAHMHPEDLPVTAAHWRDCIASGEPLHAEYRLRNRDGQYRWMLTQALPSLDKEGNIAGWIGTCTDMHELKLATQQVAQQQAKLQALLDNMPDMITRWDPHLKLLFANAAFEAKIGQPVAQLLGRSSEEMGQPDEVVKPWMKALEEVFKTGLSAEHDTHFPSAEGEKYFHSRLVPEATSDGSLQSVLATNRDITQLKKAEQKIKEQAHFIESITNATPDLIYVLDIQENTLLYVNNQVNELLGYDSTQVYKGGSVFLKQLLHPRDYARYQSYITNLATLHQEEVKETEFRLKRADGAWHWFRFRNKVFKRKEDGTIWQTIGFIQNVNERKQAEERLLTEHRRLKKAEEIAHIGSFEYKIKKDRLKWSGETSRIFGQYDKSRTVTMDKMLSLVYPDDRQLFEKCFQIARQKGESGELTYRLIYPDGAVRYVTQQIAVTKNAKRKVRCINGTVQDITRRKLIESELEQAFFELDSFVYRASHDIMAPLKSILGLVTLVQMDKTTDEQSKYLRLIELSVQKLDTFIVDLTNYSRNSRLPILSQAIDFRQLIDECLQQLSHMPHADRVKVSVELNQQTPFYSDPSRVKVICQNFISNAFKYQRLHLADPYLLIRITCTAQKACITFIDNGKGIHRDSLDKIFDMFYRASEDSYGSGLGLYIVKQVVEKLHGTIDPVNSTLGQGTTFVLSLPNDPS